MEGNYSLPLPLWFVVVVVVVIEIAVRDRILSHLVAMPAELGQHRYDASQHSLALGVLRGSQCLAGFEAVLNRRTFQRRTASNLEEAAPIGVRPLAIAFGDIQRDGLRGA